MISAHSPAIHYIEMEGSMRVSTAFKPAALVIDGVFAALCYPLLI